MINNQILHARLPHTEKLLYRFIEISRYRQTKAIIDDFNSLPLWWMMIKGATMVCNIENLVFEVTNKKEFLQLRKKLQR